MLARTNWIGLLLLLLFMAGCASAREATALPVVNSGGGGDLYPPQDLSIIAKTNRLQFLNIYANW